MSKQKKSDVRELLGTSKFSQSKMTSRTTTYQKISGVFFFIFEIFDNKDLVF